MVEVGKESEDEVCVCGGGEVFRGLRFSVLGGGAGAGVARMMHVVGQGQEGGRFLEMICGV